MNAPVVVINGKTYAWTERIDTAVIRLGQVHRAVGFVITALGGFLALVALGLAFLHMSDEDPITLLTVDFWTAPSSASFYVSLALFFCCFVFFRLKSQKKEGEQMPVWDGTTPPNIVESNSKTRPINTAHFFNKGAAHAAEQAYELAKRYGHAQVLPLHLFLGAVSDAEVAVVFGRLGIVFADLKDALMRRLQTQPLGKPLAFSESAQRVLMGAFINALMQRHTHVAPIEIFSCAVQADAFLQELFFDKNVNEQQLTNTVEWIRITQRLRERYETYRKAAAFKPTGAMNRAMTSVETKFLDSVSEDLTTAAVAGALPMLIGREREMEELLRIIEGGHQSVVLVGPDGVGKSAIIAGLAERMVEERCPNVLQDKRLVSISIPQLLSGASEAEAQERLLRVLSDVARSKNIILVFPHLEQLSRAPAELLNDFLSKGATFAIATTSAHAYTAQVEGSVLGHAFEKIAVGEPDINEAIRVVESKIGQIEYEHKVIFLYDAVEKSVVLADRYLHESYLPEKSFEVCEETALKVAKERGENARVTGEDIAKIISDKSGVPIASVSQNEKDVLLHLEERMHARVIGQEEAVSAVAAALRRGRAGLRSQNRPIANFLFLGPTGVGKTELAKTVASVFFGDENAMVRLDMSEYQDQSSIHRLIGVPGSQEGGLLTEAVRRQPFAIVLLDEFEKAHADILNVFLQVFDDGRLTDAVGRTVDFTNTVIIATSNAGAHYIQDAVMQNKPIEEMKTQLMEVELRGIYRPELLNRFDAVIVFKPLTLENVHRIAELMMQQTAKRLESKGVHFRAEPEALEELAKAGYDPKFGARPLRRVVQDRVDNAIANALLEGRVSRRDTIVLKAGGEMEIEKAPKL